MASNRSHKKSNLKRIRNKTRKQLIKKKIGGAATTAKSNPEELAKLLFKVLLEGIKEESIPIMSPEKKHDFAPKIHEYRNDLLRHMRTENELIIDLSGKIDGLKEPFHQKFRDNSFLLQPENQVKLLDDRSKYEMLLQQTQMELPKYMVEIVRFCHYIGNTTFASKYKKIALLSEIFMILEQKVKERIPEFIILKYLLDIIDILHNLVDYYNFLLHIEIGVTKTQPAVDLSAKEFYEGKVSNKMDYLGTNSTVETLGKKDNFLHIFSASRDIFQIDLQYPSLRKGINKNKFSLYQSTGKSYSAAQKGLISPFIGICLSNIPISKKNLTLATSFMFVLTDIANHLFDKLYESPDKTYTESGKVINSVTYDEHHFHRIFDDGTESKCYYRWFIKYSKNFSFSTKEDKIKYIVRRFQNWDNVDDVYNFLGADYIAQEIKLGNFIKSKYFLDMKNIDIPLDIIEYTQKGREKENPRICKDLFHNRYFSNQKLFSMRNMGVFIEHKKNIYDYQVNQGFEKENIFDKNLFDIAIKGLDDKDEQYENNIRKKILSYFYEILYYLDHKVDITTIFNDLEKLNHLLGGYRTPLFSNFVKGADHYHRTINQGILKDYVDYLVIVAKEMIIANPARRP